MMGFWGLLGDCVEGIVEFAWDSANSAVKKNAKYRKEHADRMSTEAFEASIEREEEFKSKIKQSFMSQLKHSTNCDDLKRKFNKIASNFDYDTRIDIMDSIETKRHILQEYDKLKANNSSSDSLAVLLELLEDSHELFDESLYSKMHQYISEQKEILDKQEAKRLEELERKSIEEEALQEAKAETLKRKKHDFIVKKINESIARHSYDPMDLEKLLLDNENLFDEDELESIKNSIWENY